MARPKSTAGTSNAAPEAKASSSSAAVVAYGEEKRPSIESQRSDEEISKFFESLPGVLPEQEEKKPEPKDRKPSPEPREAEGEDEDKEEAESAKKETKAKPEKSKAVMPDGDEEEAESEEDDEEEDAKGKVSEKLYKARQKKRELKEALAAEKARAAELEAKLNGAVVNAPPSGDVFTGAYAKVKTADDLKETRARLEQWIEFLEDNTDGYANGEEEVTAADAKTQLRQFRKELKRGDDVEKFFTQKEKAAAQAKELYPEVFNAADKRHDSILDLAKHYPEVARSPHSALLLGRLRAAMLLESGEYIAVKKSAAKKAEPEGKGKQEEQPREKPAREQAQETRREDYNPQRRIASVFERLAGVTS